MHCCATLDRPIALLPQHAYRPIPKDTLAAGACTGNGACAGNVANAGARAYIRASPLAAGGAPHVPVRAQVTLALAPVLALKLNWSPPTSRKLPRAPSLPLRELAMARRELRAPHATTASWRAPRKRARCRGGGTPRGRRAGRSAVTTAVLRKVAVARLLAAAAAAVRATLRHNNLAGCIPRSELRRIRPHAGWLDPARLLTAQAAEKRERPFRLSDKVSFAPKRGKRTARQKPVKR